MFSDYCLHLYCYFHISADMSSCLHQVFVELKNLHEGHIGQNDVKITIKMKTVIQKPLMIKSSRFVSEIQIIKHINIHISS